MPKYYGTGVVVEDDFKEVKYVGKTKGGKPVTITMENAINMGNIDWTMAEKNDTVAAIEMTATYSNVDANATDSELREPWNVEIDGVSEGASEVMVGVGIFYIENKPIALTRGGGKFTVEREFRQINADNDRGPVKGRIVLDGSTAKMTLNALQILTRLTDLYPAIATEE